MLAGRDAASKVDVKAERRAHARAEPIVARGGHPGTELEKELGGRAAKIHAKAHGRAHADRFELAVAGEASEAHVERKPHAALVEEREEIAAPIEMDVELLPFEGIEAERQMKGIGGIEEKLRGEPRRRSEGEPGPEIAAGAGVTGRKRGDFAIGRPWPDDDGGDEKEGDRPVTARAPSALSARPRHLGPHPPSGDGARGAVVFT